jgi:hypothetical protein
MSHLLVLDDDSLATIARSATATGRPAPNFTEAEQRSTHPSV